jgi:hypothetical protein
MQLDTLAGMVRETVLRQAAIPGGSTVLAGERGTRRVPVEEYAGWIAILEGEFPREELVTRLTLSYYPARFSGLLQSNPLLAALPFGVPDTVLKTWNSLLNVGYIEVPAAGGLRDAVGVTALWPALCSPRWASIGALFSWRGLSGVGYVSWQGTVIEVLREWLRRRRLEPTAPGDETAANVPADSAEWLRRATLQRLPRETLRGALDAVVFAAWTDAVPALPLADMLRSYYSLGPFPPGTRSADSRLDLLVTADPIFVLNGVIRTEASLRTLLTPDFLAFWVLWDIRDPAVGQYIKDGAGVLRPWFAAAAASLADTLVRVLMLPAGEQRALASWPAQPDPLYGGWDLQRGDNDATLTYAGRVRPGDPGGHVAQLSADLCTGDSAVPPGLGFTGRRDDPDSVFGAQLALLVREFQIEASQPRMWSRSVAGAWSRQPSLRRYRGLINGRLNWETRRMMQLWLNRSDFPVPDTTDLPPELEADAGQQQVANALTVFRADPANHTSNVADDLWWWNDLRDSRPRVYARDLLQRFTIPAAEVLRGDPQVTALGGWLDNPIVSPAQPPGGPALARPAQGSWASVPFDIGGLLNANVFPAPVDVDRPMAESTFATVFAMAFPELGGRLDIYNAWDRARMSIGLCHWTQALVLDPVVTGELAAFLAWYKDRSPDSFAGQLGSWGIDVDGFATMARGLRGVRTGPIKVWGLTANVPESPGPIPRAESDLIEWFRSWRSVFRLLGMLRLLRPWGIAPEVSDSALLLAMWGLARWRIQQALGGPWSSEPPVNADILGAAGGPATFGEILTSEAAVAALMRWHINLPARVFPNGAENVVQGAVRTAAAIAGHGLPVAAAALAVDPVFATRVVDALADPLRDPGNTVRVRAAVDAVIPDLGGRVPSRVPGSFQLWGVGI